MWNVLENQIHAFRADLKSMKCRGNQSQIPDLPTLEYSQTGVLNKTLQGKSAGKCNLLLMKKARSMLRYLRVKVLYQSKTEF